MIARKPGNVLLLAVVLGALCAALVYRQLRAQQHELEAVKGAAARPTTAVVVASRSIPIGTRIEAGDVRIVPWPTDIEPDGALDDPAAAIGNVARSTIERNQPITQAVLVSAGQGLLPAMIEEGKRAVSVKVDDVTGVSGFITPSSRVDVLVAGTPDGEPGQKSKLVLQNVQVLAIGSKVEASDEHTESVPTVTLLVTPEEAETLALAARYEPVRLALRNYRDQGVVVTPGVSADALFGDRAPVETPPAEAPRAKPGRSIELLLGGESTKVLF